MISGPQQAHHVGELGEAIAREDFLGDRRAADDLAPLEHDHLLAGAREIRGRDQAVVAGADHDRIVVYCWPRLFLLPLGFVERQRDHRAGRLAAMVLHRDFHRDAACPARRYGRCRCTSAMYFFSTGDQVLVEA